ncbi:protein YgfX [uncultured Paraglaciecola sp.]|uniref:protein YgfX n=1 Tax=uncultured Paraglaciecola sp. TaxID=1765024 RepID=UPI00261417C6|nr:protein YgfX [uncultured Paraglaciecola sp.]
MQLLTYVVLVVSVFIWQPNIFPFQIVLQVIAVIILSFFVFKEILHSIKKTQAPAILSEQGEWLEVKGHNQTSWKLTDKSRISSLLLFIHLVSTVNARHSKWRLVYKDQVTERDFRRLCRAVIFQQQRLRDN